MRPLPNIVSAAVGCLCLFQLGFSANSLGREYSFGFSKGNLVRNWSFEDRGNNWFDEEFVKARFVAKTDGITAVSGSYVARYAATNTTGATIDRLISDVFPVEANTAYTLSLYVTTSENSANVYPVVWFYSDPGQTYLGPGIGQKYPEDADWTLQQATFTSPDKATYARIALVEAAPNEGGDFYFDDVVLEKGSSMTPRSDVVEAVSFVNDLGQAAQNQLKVGGGGSDAAGRKYLVQASTFDDSRRPVTSYEPYVKSGDPDYDASFAANATSYNNGSNGRGTLGSAPYSSVAYFNQPGAQVQSANAPADGWKGSTKALRSDRYFVKDLVVPGYSAIENQADDHLAHPYQFAWSKDVNGNYDLSWSNEKGETVQRAFRTPGRAVLTSYEYFPNGQLKKVLTPLDNPSDETNQSFKEVANYNSAGELTSSYTKDRGLRKFWYNRLGQLRFTQHESQGQYTFDYTDYDFLDRPISMGTQIINNFLDEMEDSRSLSSPVKTEHKGFIYDNLDAFQARTGLNLSALLPGKTLGVNGQGRVVCAYHLNNEVDLATYSPADKFIATFYNYNAYGEVSEAYKYIGPIKTPVQKIHKATYAYDQLHRLQTIDFYDDNASPVLLTEHTYTYDPYGRVSRVTGKQGKLICRYEYFDWGGMKSVTLGGDEHFGTGTKIEYAYHSEGWVKEIKATRLATSEITFQENLGYESKSIDQPNVPDPKDTAFDGKITQQLYKFAQDVNTLGPVRLFNYNYDDLNRMTEADFRKSTAPFLLNNLQQINFNNLIWDLDNESMDSRLIYDDVGRIINNRSGVPASDQAVYHYQDQDKSYRLDHVDGKLGGAPTRNMASAGTFQYDPRGRLYHDDSKKMTLAYGWDDMPTRFDMDHGDGTMTSEYEFYDATGNRISRVDVLRAFHQGDLAQFVGTLEPGESGNPYSYSTLDQAFSAVQTQLQSGGLTHVSQIHLFVVPNSNQDEIIPTQDIQTLTDNSGNSVTLEMEGVIKFSPRYNELVAQYQNGTPLSATHDINLVASGDEQWFEAFDANGAINQSLATRGVFGRGGKKVGRIVTGGDYEFFVKNHLGSTMRVVADEGDYLAGNTWALDYMTYGDLRKLKVGATDVAETFTGKELEGTTGLYAFGARWMDPQLGMFVSPDPAHEFLNPFSYTGGSPNSSVDPDGREDGCDAGCDIGGGGQEGPQGGPGGPNEGGAAWQGIQINIPQNFSNQGPIQIIAPEQQLSPSIQNSGSSTYSGPAGTDFSGGGYGPQTGGGRFESSGSPGAYGGYGPSGSGFQGGGGPTNRGLSAALPPPPPPMYLFPKSPNTPNSSSEAEKPANGLNYLNDALSKVNLGVGLMGTGAGIREYANVYNGQWLGSNGVWYSPNFKGNGSVSGYKRAFATAERAHAIGKGLFIVGTGLAIYKLNSAVQNGDLDQGVGALMDEAVGYWALAGGIPGLIGGAAYTGLDMAGFFEKHSNVGRAAESPQFMPDATRIGY